MNLGYMIYQAEHPLSSIEQRAVDASLGEFARGLSQLLHSLHRRHAGSAHQAACLPEAIAVPDYPPAEWARDARAECR